MFGKKKTAEHYIKVYCAYSDAEIRNREIALESPTIFEKLIDHAGEMPSSSGFMPDTLVNRIDRMRKIHPDYPASMSLLRALSKKQAWCCISWGYLVNRRPPESKKILKTVKDVAAYLDEIVEGGVSYDCYKKTRQRGIDKINAELGIFVA